MRNLAPFAIGSVIRKLNHIHCQISAKHQIPFPKPGAFWRSKYVYERRCIRIHDDGRLERSLSRFVSSPVDFSFVRSIVAHKYSLVEIAERLGFLSYKIIATDGTLFHPRARYKGYTWFEGECNCVEFVGILKMFGEEFSTG